MDWSVNKLSQILVKAPHTLNQERDKHTWACSHVQEELKPGLIFPHTIPLDESSLLSFHAGILPCILPIGLPLFQTYVMSTYPQGPIHT